MNIVNSAVKTSDELYQAIRVQKVQKKDGENKGLLSSVDTLFFGALAFMAVLALVFILCFIFVPTFKAIREIGIANFLGGKRWKPEMDTFGILPMIVGTLVVTTLAVAASAPISLAAAIFITRMCPKKLQSLSQTIVDFLGSIPSVIYGFVALGTVVPLVAKISGGLGTSVLSASIVLALMISPTVISISSAAIRSVDKELLTNALALGDTRVHSIWKVELAAAKSGIMASIILGFCRAMGETMAVIMVAGNQAIFPNGLFGGVRTLTGNIALELGYAASLHKEALIATAGVLFCLVLIVNVVLGFVQRKEGRA